MSYTNQQTSSLADLISKLNTFLSGTPGWTTHHVPASGEFAARKTGTGFDIGFATQWDTGSPNNLGIYQWHNAAYNAGNSPWNQNDDSGSGAASTTDATIGGQRHAPITNSPVQFWCFEDDDYFHVVVETSDGIYCHFGAGYLVKNNDWTGGEYVYGYEQKTGISSNVAVAADTTILLDGLCADAGSIVNMEERCATVHCESMLNQPAGGKYAVFMGNQNSANLGNDRQAVPVGRIHFAGGFRGGPGQKEFGDLAGSQANGLAPFYPIVAYHWDRTTDDVVGPLGQVADVRGCSLRNFAAAEEVTIGSDTWVVFPSYRRSPAPNTVFNYSGYQGIAYKKVTT